MKSIILFSILTLVSYAGNEMELLYLKNACQSCHGIYGQGMGNSPRLQGQREEVLLKRLKNLQVGITRSPFGSVMISFAQSLDENQTKAMAKYLSTLTTKRQVEHYELEYDSSGDGGS